MVRHVRFAWDHSRPLPEELLSRGWDCDGPDIDDEDIPRRSSSLRKTVGEKSAPPRRVSLRRRSRQEK